tara:strand:+ start:3488 stop:4777 length:1290 start_codon:yes stop_codon:yes gene_type:complete
MKNQQAKSHPHLGPPEGKTHVVVLGGGFGGLEFCKELDNSERFHITLIDRQNHHLFQPLLYQVASAGLAAPEIAQPLRAILSERTNLDVLMEEVTSINLENREVTTSERTLNYDHLVIALGVKTSYFGHDHWAKHSHALKSLRDATQIRAAILRAFELAEASDDEDEIRKLMTTVVIGGGPTGVELAGAFAELAKRVMAHDFRRINPRDTRIILVEGMDRLLTMYPEDLSEYTKQRLEGIGVEVRVGAMVEDVGDGYVVVAGERIETANVLWAAGVEAPAIVRNLGVETDRAGRLKVRPDLSLPGHPEVYAIGDIVSLIDANGKAVPGLCPAAIQMGDYVARQLGRGQTGPFKYLDKGSMATIGRSAAVATSGGAKFTGFIAWLMWLFIHLLFLIGFRNKVAVFWQWVYSYMTYKRGARIITGVETTTN